MHFKVFCNSKFMQKSQDRRLTEFYSFTKIIVTRTLKNSSIVPLITVFIIITRIQFKSIFYRAYRFWNERSLENLGTVPLIKGLPRFIQGNNARKVISEVYASFVLQCTVSGCNVNTRRMSQPCPCHSLTWDPSFT